MLRYVLLTLIFLFVTNTPFSQGNKLLTGYRLLYSRAEKLYHSPSATDATDSAAMQAYLQVTVLLMKERKYNDTLVDSYLKCGILLMSKNNPKTSLMFFHDAVSVVKNNKKLSDSLLFKPYLYAGTIHYGQNNLDSTVYYYKKAEIINSSYPGLSESERLFNKFGALYYETGDYDKSINYFGKALSIVESKKPYNVFFAITYKNNIATAMMKLGKYREALAIFNDLLKYPNPADELLYNVGNTYFEINDYRQALSYLRKIHHMEFEKFIGLTKIFIHLKTYDSAGIYLNKAKVFYNNKKNVTPVITRGIILKYSGDLSAAAGKYLEALGYYQSAIISLDPVFKDTSLSANPTSFSGLQNFGFLFDALVSKASLLGNFDQPVTGGKNLALSLRAYGSALSLARHIEKTYFSDDARLFLLTKVNPATQQAVTAAIRLHDLTGDPHFINEAFAFEENNKASVLQTGLKNLELSALPDLPSDLVTKEKTYRTELARLRVQNYLVKDSVSAISVRKKIEDLEIALSGVQDKLDENPLYHGLKFDNATPDMDSIRKNMNGSNEAILSYYYTGSRLICFYITNDHSGFTSVPLHDTLFSTILSLRKELQFPQASGRRNLQKAGLSLFEMLIRPVYDKLKGKTRLIIIPFNEIGYVPFEMLINPLDGNLLLDRFAISYNYAAGFLNNLPARTKQDYRVLAMAPFTDKGNKNLILSPLSSSAEEINGLPGMKFLGKEAGKDRFIAFASQYPVIHLATHAIANDTNLLGSFIEFYGLKNDADTIHRLYEQEIYTLDLKTTRLLILSACETGDGLLVNGEGIISLSRAFAYAGCKSVVTTLWKADEISTSFICKRLHYYLQKGLPIDEALQKAKIDYLETNDVDERYKNPAYWAHLVLIGDFRPIAFSGFNWNIIWIGIIVCLILFLFLRGKKNQA
jgi:CHAT domain-containing protein/Tfp pilus assembly protein PilF